MNTTSAADTTEPVAVPPRWAAFALVCFAYLGVTVGEQALSPVMPLASVDLGFGERRAGLAFGLLAAAIAVGNLIGGAVLARLGPRLLMSVGLACTAAGGVVSAVAPTFGVLVGGQVLLGLGAGLYFPAGLRAVPLVSGSGRRGFAMGIYGVAFSVGLMLAALLGTVGAFAGWRAAFWVSAGLGAAEAAATWFLALEAERGPVRFRIPLAAVIGLPTFIGAVGAVCQYGAIPFITIYAVGEWGLTPARAAMVLAVGRAISILAKVAAGASMDRVGPIVSARRTGVLLAATGLAWVLLPGGLVAYAAAALFAGTVSSLFPVANLVAVDRFGSDGPALGAYRSAQIGIGAIAGALIGVVGAAVGLRVTLAVAVACPAVLVALRTERRPSHAT